jgi:hypothetical protein
MIETLILAALLQTHPCDAPNSASATVRSGAAITMEYCQPPANNVDAITVYVNGVARHLSAIARVTTGVNAAGLALYSVSIGQFARGSFNIQVTAWNKNEAGVAQEGPPSLPFALTVVDAIALPAAPQIKRIYR